MVYVYYFGFGVLLLFLCIILVPGMLGVILRVILVNAYKLLGEVPVLSWCVIFI